jgi:hypothetical protein
MLRNAAAMSQWVHEVYQVHDGSRNLRSESQIEFIYIDNSTINALYTLTINCIVR